jgi:glucose-6-phosphate isomerase
VWSAIGLPLAIAIGKTAFLHMLEGGQAMDQHFMHTPAERNLPLLMALWGVWNRNFLNCPTQLVSTYPSRLVRFAPFVQQMDMESNGKSTTMTGEKVDYSTGPIIWGQPGTNGQHAFFQLIHQGTKLIPCDFLAAANSHYKLPEHHDILISNFLAQPEALMNGLTEDEVKAQLSPEQQADPVLVASKVFVGNKPSNSFLFQKMTPKTLGALLAF